VSDSPANVEAIADAGLVVPYGDVQAFADAFALLARDPQQRHALGNRARERAARHFTSEEMLRRTRALYDEIGRLR
jgi:glycosyltransferase involved in cell wall biosynthesis